MSAGTFDPRARVIKIKTKQGQVDYLKVADRLAWFRNDCPDGTLLTEHIMLTEQLAVFKATATRYGPDGTPAGSATGYGSETAADFRDHVEKSETKAIGRALAALGFGLQFAGADFDTGAPVDAPVTASADGGRPPDRPPDKPRERPARAQLPERPKNVTEFWTLARRAGIGSVSGLHERLGREVDMLAVTDWGALWDEVRDRVPEAREAVRS